MTGGRAGTLARLAWLRDELTFPGPVEHQFLPVSGAAANANMGSLLFRALAVEIGLRMQDTGLSFPGLWGVNTLHPALALGHHRWAAEGHDLVSPRVAQNAWVPRKVIVQGLGFVLSAHCLSCILT